MHDDVYKKLISHFLSVCPSVCLSHFGVRISKIGVFSQCFFQKSKQLNKLACGYYYKGPLLLFKTTVLFSRTMLEETSDPSAVRKESLSIQMNNTEEVKSTPEVGSSSSPQKLRRELGFVDGICFIISIMIGSGIFASPGVTLDRAGSPGG
jgi:hypothetical protein